MLFNSFSYTVFLPTVFALYWILPHKFRWVLLLTASYYFYMCWNAKYVLIIAFITAVTFVSAIIMEKTESVTLKKASLITSVICSLAILFVFKYFNFFLGSLSDILGRFAIHLNPVTLKLLLPVGISFYTFQSLSYVIDVYRGKVKAERHFGYYATFISFFPQLVAGPIERTTNLLPQIRSEHTFDYDKAVDGAIMMLWGFYKKLVIADNIGKYVDLVYSDVHGGTGMDHLLAVLFFTIQIYCDFSGYSDIAIGTAKLLDIDLSTNFRTPYFSSSIREFWSRWHISLSSWFKDYVYIPLGGNRCSKFRNQMNVLITFLVSGLWHGANWTFVIWGGIHGLAQVIENLLGKVLSKIRNTKAGRIVLTILVFIFCNYAWVFFRANSLSEALFVTGSSFRVFLDPGSVMDCNIISLKTSALIMLYVVILAVHDYLGLKGIALYRHSGRFGKIIRFASLVMIGVMIVFCSPKGMPAEFVYFQF